jgi:hypothetical protein
MNFQMEPLEDLPPPVNNSNIAEVSATQPSEIIRKNTQNIQK